MDRSLETKLSQTKCRQLSEALQHIRSNWLHLDMPTSQIKPPDPADTQASCIRSTKRTELLEMSKSQLQSSNT
jgi:hypothetical protein